jgi:hypothetical protein
LFPLPGKDLHLANVLLLAGLPHQLDGVGLDICHREFSNLQKGKKLFTLNTKRKEKRGHLLVLTFFWSAQIT